MKTWGKSNLFLYIFFESLHHYMTPRMSLESDQLFCHLFWYLGTSLHLSSKAGMSCWEGMNTWGKSKLLFIYFLFESLHHYITPRMQECLLKVTNFVWPFFIVFFLGCKGRTSQNHSSKAGMCCWEGMKRWGWCSRLRAPSLRNMRRRS